VACRLGSFAFKLGLASITLSCPLTAVAKSQRTYFRGLLAGKKLEACAFTQRALCRERVWPNSGITESLRPKI